MRGSSRRLLCERARAVLVRRARRNAPGEILRFAYWNPDFTPAELCRIAENVLGDTLAIYADITAQ